MAHKTLDMSEGYEIDSVWSFLKKINEIRENDEDYALKYFFRGQQVEYWGIYSSIFRMGLLNSEHQLLKEPIEKFPEEFNSINNTFDLMTKCQHYGLCTRLLDLTTNPLVALYFACQINGEEEYFKEKEENEDEENNIELLEPWGLIYYKKAYPVYSDDKYVKIVTELAKYNLQNENSLENVINRLYNSDLITEREKNDWLGDGFERFINIIQSTYVVQPTNNNIRLMAQSGAFLLPSMFSYKGEDEKGVITKCKGSLKDEFEKEFFYVSGENKQKILDELNLCNINESTLFPELEHQLRYIKTVNMKQTFDAPDFERYEKQSNHKDYYTNIMVENEGNPNFKDELFDYIVSKSEDKVLAKRIAQCIFNNLCIDWYKKEFILSKMLTLIIRELYLSGINRDSSRIIAKDIVEKAVQLYVKNS